ncbi:MAG TPA: TonB-dependent receptor, partial [Nitrospira sp.]|nr:TonB-dependent receptor [Nitrospira sp.]
MAGVFKTNVDSVTASIEFSPNKRIWSRTLLSIGDAYIRRYSQPGLGENRSNVRDWHAETVADWKPSQTLRITGGLSYVRSTTHQRIDLSQLSGLGQFDDEQRSLGLFGEASWRFYPRFELNAGLRYQNDRQVRTGELARGAGAIPLEYGRSFDAVLPKVSLAFEVDANLDVGVLAQRAYNPGGATLRFDTGLPDELDAERLWDFELFTRATLGHGLRVRFNIFQSEIRDAQRSRPVLIVAP